MSINPSKSTSSDLQSATILHGKWFARQFERGIASQVEKVVAANGRAPGLGVILVGDDKASKVYVGMKEKTAKRCGFITKEKRLDASSTQQQVIDAVKSFNTDNEIDGILVQLPLPDHIDENIVVEAISPQKDADGLHPFNQGLLLAGKGVLRPCTPTGAMKLIDLAFSGFDGNIESELDVALVPTADLSGKNAIVIGRSILVGKPVAFLLLEQNATVTVAHSRTSDLPKLVSDADIVVAAVGREEMVKGEWIKPGAIVIDVGINRTSSGSLVGDVAFDEASHRSSAITPVPKGVGPMTVIMLMQNTLKAYEARESV